MGISLKRFDGWEPTTSYTYDEEGRLVSSVPEVEWDEQEQAWMLALTERESLCCNGCGGWLPETTDLANDDRYVPPKPVRCHSCSALAIGRKMRGDKENPQVQRWPVPKLMQRG